jgi:hypothetical protein
MDLVSCQISMSCTCKCSQEPPPEDRWPYEKDEDVSILHSKLEVAA